MKTHRECIIMAPLPDNNHEVEFQRRYYATTANNYNKMHVHEKDEHFFALCFLISSLDYFEIKSILDVGSGTGRALAQIKKLRPDIRSIGIEPVEELREIGYRLGISNDELIEGDATNLQFNDKQFDLVCEFGVLHHIRNPENAISEMLRVSKKAIFISDSNNFGQGTFVVRSVKQIINLLGLWNIANFMRTKGRGYTISDGDGLAYSYSVFNNYRKIRKECVSVHLLNTQDGGINPYRTAGHVALLGIKKS